MSYYQDRIKLVNTNKATLIEMSRFLTLWECVCGICPICDACYKVNDLLEEEKELPCCWRKCESDGFKCLMEEEE